MKPGTIVFNGQSKSGKNLIFRYPTENDLQVLCDYINNLSKEKTFILFQGEQVSLEDEKRYLDTQLKAISIGKAVQLLAFSEGILIGNTQINLYDKATKHVGIFGIALAKEFRGEGIGALLMEKIIKEAEKNLQGLKIIILSRLGNNEIAEKLYKKMGFKEYGRLPEGVTHREKLVDHVYMYKKIN